jgi:nitrogen fixation protein NifU and related proteins
MSELTELYQEIILDHYKSPRNFRELEAPTHAADGANPLCGDKLRVYVKVNEAGVIEDVSFKGSGCAISKASASLMTTQIKGKTVAEAEELFHLVHEMLTGHQPCPPHNPSLGKLQVLAGVCEFPVRVKCATLAWHTLHAALKHQPAPASTEKP